MTLDSAWRQVKGAARDLQRAAERHDGAWKAWAVTLDEQFRERLDEARELGIVDITTEKGLLTIGVPCQSCLTIITAKTRRGHKIFIGGKDSPPAYAQCDGDTVDPETDMPVWPPMPKPVAE